MKHEKKIVYVNIGLMFICGILLFVCRNPDPLPRQNVEENLMNKIEKKCLVSGGELYLTADSLYAIEAPMEPYTHEYRIPITPYYHVKCISPTDEYLVF